MKRSITIITLLTIVAGALVSAPVFGAGGKPIRGIYDVTLVRPDLSSSGFVTFFLDCWGIRPDGVLVPVPGVSTLLVGGKLTDMEPASSTDQARAAFRGRLGGARMRGNLLFENFSKEQILSGTLKQRFPGSGGLRITAVVSGAKALPGGICGGGVLPAFADPDDVDSLFLGD